MNGVRDGPTDQDSQTYDPLTPPSVGSCIEVNGGAGVRYLWRKYPTLASLSIGSRRLHRADIYGLVAEVEGSASSRPVKASRSSDPISEGLLTVQYAPRVFSELISCDATNIDLLKWLKGWMNADCSKTDRRHLCPIALIAGPPGLGKTTLAHVVAKTAGFAPLEINASDERTGESLVDRINAILTSTPLFDQKPTCLVLDEIDGAADGSSPNSLVPFLVKLLASSAPLDLDDSVPAAASKRRSVSRPIICICNDVYAAVLRPLRFALDPDLVFHVRKPLASVLTTRLRSICEEEGMEVDVRALLHLTEQLDCDIRSCLNAIQFIGKRRRVLTMSSLGTELALWKDTQSSLMTVIESIFSNSGSYCDAGKRLPRLFDMFSNDYGRVVSGCFEMYPEARFFDNRSMDRVNCALDWMSWWDCAVSKRSLHDCPSLIPYGTTVLLQLRSLFAAPNQPHFQYPRQDYELFMEQKRTQAITKAFCDGLPTAERARWLHDELLAFLIPSIISRLQPDCSLFSTVNPTLLGNKGRAEVDRIVSVLQSYGLRIKQTKADSSYSFHLDPAIDCILAKDESCLHIVAYGPTSKSFAVYQIVAQQMKPLAKPHKEGSKGPAVASSIARAPTPPLKKQKKDFFGRPAGKDSQLKATIIEKPDRPAFWFRFNEGYSNAVRREVKMETFYALLNDHKK